MSKNFWIVLVLVVGGLIGLFTLTGDKSSTISDTKYADGNVLTVKDSDHKSGAGNKKVTIIEYGDFQCPSCARLFPIIEQAREEYKDEVTFVFRHFPITSIHPNAQAAARAAEAAGAQGKFFEMYQQLYSTQADWSSASNAQSTFEGYAQKLKLDVAKFKTDFASEATNARITADLDSGKKIGVNGTPGIFINGKQQESPVDYAEFKRWIDDAISKANPTPATSPEPATQPTE